MSWDFLQMQTMRNISDTSDRIIQKRIDQSTNLERVAAVAEKLKEQLNDKGVRHALKHASDAAGEAALREAVETIARLTNEPIATVAERINVKRHQVFDAQIDEMIAKKQLRHEPRTTDRLAEEVRWYKRP